MEEARGHKKIIVEVPEKLHKEVKTRALTQNITMKVYVLQAIFEKIAQEKQYE